MRQKLRTLYIFVAFLALHGCSQPFQYAKEPMVWRLAPSELQTVRIDKSSDLYKTGLGALQNKQYNKSLAYFSEALKEDTVKPQALLGVASSYSLLGQFQKADQYFELYQEEFGTTVAYLNDHGFSFILRGDYLEAERLFLKASNRKPNSMTVKNNLMGVRKLQEASS